MNLFIIYIKKKRRIKIMANKRLILVLLICTFILSFLPTTFAIEPAATSSSTTLDRANALSELGLFAGTDKGFDLESKPNRTQAIIFLLRMLGEEKTAQNSSYLNPFTDVPAWADKYVSYAYAKGYTSGISKTEFGTNNIATPEQFITFMLRAIGYSDKAGEFTLPTAIKKAETLGIFPADNYQVGSKTFNRGDCVDVIYNFLSANKKGEDITVAESLIASEAIDSEIAAKYGFVEATISPKNIIDLSSKMFTNNNRLTILSCKSLWNNCAFIRCEIAPIDEGIKATNIYLSKDGTNYETLKITPVMDWSNITIPFVHLERSYYNFHNLEFSTTYTICIEISPDIFMTPVTIKTPDAQAAEVSGYGAPHGNKSEDGICTFFEVGINPTLDGDWSYQFYRWTPGSNPIAISGASGIANGSAVVFYEPTSKDLNNYVFWRVTNDDGITIENAGVYVNFIKGSPIQKIKR